MRMHCNEPILNWKAILIDAIILSDVDCFLNDVKFIICDKKVVTVKNVNIIFWSLNRIHVFPVIESLWLDCCYIDRK